MKPGHLFPNLTSNEVRAAVDAVRSQVTMQPPAPATVSDAELAAALAASAWERMTAGCEEIKIGRAA